jgi:hypothetical protein
MRTIRLVVLAAVTAAGLLAASAGTIASQDDDAPEQAPVEITGRILCGPEVQHGNLARNVVPLDDGEMIIVRDRGFAWRQSTNSMSDPRLEGTVHQSADSDSYTLPGGEAGPELGISTKRIENDEGAWQGSSVQLKLPDGTWEEAPYVMVGEGAYEGLTAIYSVDIFDCGEDIWGYIIDGTIPAIPEPFIE